MSKSISRRRFLEESLIGITAAAGAAYAASAGTVLAQTPARTIGPNDQIGVAVFGCGGQGGGHINAFRGIDRTTILYLVDADPTLGRTNDTQLDAIAETQRGVRPQRVPDMRRVLDDPAVDVVSIAATNHWHALATVWSLQAGKHVYVEKPGNHNVHEGIAVAAAAAKYGKVVQIGTQARSAQACRQAVRFVQEGGIGEVNFVRAIVYRAGRRETIGRRSGIDVPANIDYNLWSGPAPLVPNLRRNFHYYWHWQRLYGNGDFGNQGTHQTDIARWFLNLYRHPNAIITYGNRAGLEERVPEGFEEVGDAALQSVSILDYGDKCIVFEVRGLGTREGGRANATAWQYTPDGSHHNFHISSAARGNSRAGGNRGQVAVICYGSNGYVVSTDSYSYAAAYDLEGNLMREFTGGGNHRNNFLDAVVANNPAAVTAPASEAEYSGAIAHLSNISYYLGEKNEASPSYIKAALRGIRSLDNDDETVDRTVAYLEANNVELDFTPLSLGPLLTFNPETKRFIGNEAANEMLTREYRAPFIVPKPEDV